MDHAHAGQSLAAVVRARASLAWSAARERIWAGQVTVDGVVERDPGARPGHGARVELAEKSAAPRARAGVLTRDRVVALETHFIVVDKAPGVSTVPFEPGEKDTLVDQVRAVLRRSGGDAAGGLFTVHRLDKETSGLLVFARTWLAQRHLAGLFRSHKVERIYYALVHGAVRANEQRIESRLLEDRGDGLRGSSRAPGKGVRAVTHVRVLARLAGGATLVTCQLETGRTHQIRIHLSEAGHPLLGERVYIRGFHGPVLPAPRILLHAAVLGFTHPARTDEALRFQRELPEDFTQQARALGAADASLRVG